MVNLIDRVKLEILEPGTSMDSAYVRSMETALIAADELAEAADEVAGSGQANAAEWVRYCDALTAYRKATEAAQ